MGKLLPLLFLLLGTAAGAGAGLLLAPPAAPGPGSAASTQDGGAEAAPAGRSGAGGKAGRTRADRDARDSEFVKLNNQFIVPVLRGERVVALVVLSLSLEVAPGTSEAVYAVEPKLRDAFLGVLFAHANAGGFAGRFTSGRKMAELRTALREAAAGVLGPPLSDVLITDIMRQDTRPRAAGQ